MHRPDYHKSKLDVDQLEWMSRFDSRIVLDSEWQTVPEKVAYAFEVQKSFELCCDFTLEGTITYKTKVSIDTARERARSRLRDILCLPHRDELTLGVKQEALVIYALGWGRLRRAHHTKNNKPTRSNWHVHWWAHCEKATPPAEIVLQKLTGRYRPDGKATSEDVLKRYSRLGDCEVKYYDPSNHYPVYGVGLHQEWNIWDLCPRIKRACKKNRCEYLGRNTWRPISTSTQD